LEASIRSANDTYPNLLAAIGKCNAFAGSGDPYLPFRDILAMLTGEVESQWAARRISTDESVDELVEGLLNGEVTTEQIGRRRFFFGGYNPASQFVSLHLSSQGLICRLAAGRSTKSVRSFFWQVMRVVEFLRLKDQIYQDYAEFLQSEIVRLRSYHLSMNQKRLKEEVRKLSVYDLTIPTYLLALDSYVRSLPPDLAVHLFFAVEANPLFAAARAAQGGRRGVGGRGGSVGARRSRAVEESAFAFARSAGIIVGQAGF
jgi:hypothetical protein